VSRNGPYIDANAVIRFITADDMDSFNEVAELLTGNKCLVPIEVLAEVVYNLRDKYCCSRQIIRDKLADFMAIQEDVVPETNAVRHALNVYASTKLDFVDCVLLGYAKINNRFVFTYDEELKKHLGEKAFNV
jgi:predicted nucleic-acid-binding protein